MKYYITGAHGFIGSALTRYLDNPQQSPLREADVIINLAAYGNHYFQTDPELIVKANIHDLHRLLEKIKDTNYQKFYNISTSSVHLEVKTLYAASKLFGEILVDSYKDPRNVNVRPYSVYGPGEAGHRFIPTVIRHLHSGKIMDLAPDARHDWVYVTDFVKLMMEGHTEIGTGYSYTNFDVVHMLEVIAGKTLNWREVKLREYDTANWVAPKIIPGTITLYEGLRNTYEHFTQTDFRDQ